MTFVVCIDNSDSSTIALEYAASIAEDMNVNLELVHVANPSIHNGENGYVQESEENARKKGKMLLEEAEEHISDYSLDYEKIILYGDPLTSIKEYLENDGAKAVYIGHRAMESEHEELFGSFAKSLISSTPVPVTVVNENINPENISR